MNRPNALFALVTLLMASCASAPPGDDPRGRQLKEPASKVLEALEQFKKDQGRYPNSLYELSPRYIDKLPDEPALRLDEFSATLRFAYSRDWPRLGRVVCVTVLGSQEWKCEDYK